MARTARGGRKHFRRRNRDDTVASDDANPRDVTQYVGDYLIPDDQQTATSKWHPSRRGVSPHHRG